MEREEMPRLKAFCHGVLLNDIPWAL